MKIDINHLSSSKYAKWIIIGLISFFSCLTVGEFLSLLFSNNENHVAIESILQQEIKNESFNDILNSSLFGVYVPNDLNEDHVKKSMLNVTLVGIMFSDPISDSQVIIRSANGEENTYSLGDKIPGGALIKKIMSAGVLVERNGTLERLSLPKNTLNFEPLAQPLIGE